MVHYGIPDSPISKTLQASQDCCESVVLAILYLVRQNEQADRMAPVDITTTLQLGRAEVLRGFEKVLNKEK